MVMGRNSTTAASWALCFLLFALAVADVSADAVKGSREARVKVTGILQVYQADDFERKTVQTLYALEDTDSGRRYKLRFAELPSHRLTTGSRVTVEGIADGKLIHVLSSSDYPQMTPTTTAAVGGERRAVILVVDFSDEDVGCSDSQIGSLMFSNSANSVDGLLRESSWGQVSFPGDTDNNGSPDVFRVGISAFTSQNCDASGWATMADQAASASGVVLGQYQHRVYVLPSGNACEWAGMATLGCFGSCRSWVSTCSLPDVYAHELGHNLGMRHASTDPQNDGTVDAEYGDYSDFMGIGGIGWRQPNAPHKEEMGWLSAEQVTVADEGSHTVVISALETHPNNAQFPQVVKVPRSGGGHYYLSYRQPTGYDATIRPTYRSKLNIHSWRGNGNNTLYITALNNGEQFEDPASDLTVTQLSRESGRVTLLLTVGSGPPAINDLSADTIYDWFLRLDWSPTPGATNYRIYRNDQLVALTYRDYYSDFTVVPGTVYSYHVVAVDGSGLESEESNSVNAGVFDTGQPPRIRRIRP
jgi:hypothetical protein